MGYSISSCYFSTLRDHWVPFLLVYLDFFPPAWVTSPHSWAGTNQYSAEYSSGNLHRPLGFSFYAALYSLVWHPAIKNKISWSSQTFSCVSSTQRVCQPLPGFFLSCSTKLGQSLHLIHLFPPLGIILLCFLDVQGLVNLRFIYYVFKQTNKKSCIFFWLFRLLLLSWSGVKVSYC